MPYITGKQYKEMKEKEILEGNKLIVEFMNYPKDRFLKSTDYENGLAMASWPQYANELSFHTSWDCLMPILTKIGETLQSDPILCKKEIIMFLDWDLTALNIELVWKTCVNFIKKYNDQSK